MTTAAYSLPLANTNLWRPVFAGGAIAGTLDYTLAMITFGSNMPRHIAAGLLGRPAAHSTSIAVWILGTLLHFFIAFSAATIYNLASRKLEFLADHWLVCGLFYGIAVWLVMNLVVLPLSSSHFMGPYQYAGVLQGILVHMFIIGLPISFSLHKLAK